MNKITKAVYLLGYGALTVLSFYEFITVPELNCLLWLAASIVFSKQFWRFYGGED